MEALIDRHDAAVASVLADPRVANDDRSELVQRYLALFAPGSTFPTSVLASWREEAARGRFYRAGPRGQMVESTVMTVTPGSADEVTFTVCSQNSIQITDAAGNVIEAEGGVTAGEVVAVRVDGAWLLRDLTQKSPAGCPRPRANE